MCRLFVTQDPATYAAETRSVRLHGHVTSIRLEAAFWSVLEEIAVGEGVSVSRFVTTLNDEVMAEGAELGNLASFLRVSCLCYLHHKQAREPAYRPDPGTRPTQVAA